MLKDCTSPLPADLTAGDDDARILLNGLLDRRAQLRSQSIARHGEQIVHGMPRRHLQIAVGRPKGIEALVLAIDQDGGRRIGLHHHCRQRSAGRLGVTAPGPAPNAKGLAHAIACAPRKSEFSLTAATDVPIEPLLLRDDLEAAIGVADRLRTAKKKNAALAQREMEDRDDLCLRFGLKIDQQIPARDQIEPRERRIGQHVLHGEDHRRAQFRQHPVAVIFLREKAGEPLRRYVCLDRFGIKTLSRAGDGVRIDIGGEDLQLDVSIGGGDLLAEEHG